MGRSSTGFLTWSPPPFDLDEWRSKPYLARLKANCQDWAVNGFGSPGAVYWLYVVKVAVYAAAGLLVIAATTRGVGGIGDIGDWWTKPIVFQKFALWTVLWEALGIGSGSGPLAARFWPPFGGALYWLR